VELPIKGTIPAAVAGTLYRTGPGTFKVEGSDFECDHWFDGFAHVHRFQIEAQPDGACKVFYNSRRQNDALVEHARKHGNLDGVSFGQKRDPCESLFQKMKTSFTTATNPPRLEDVELRNVGVTPHIQPAALSQFPGKKTGGKENDLMLRTDAAFEKPVCLSSIT
jgi:torulene dioxygenase